MKVAKELCHEYPDWASVEFVAKEFIENSKAV